MPYQYQERESLEHKWVPQFTHQPDLISKSACRSVESNKDDFFQRLYDVRLEHQAHQLEAILSVEIDTVRNINRVHPKPLTKEQRLQTSNRYASIEIARATITLHRFTHFS